MSCLSFISRIKEDCYVVICGLAMGYVVIVSIFGW